MYKRQGFTLAGADHAIIPVMLGDAVVAQKFARELQKEGIYVTGFIYPVVPKGPVSYTHLDVYKRQALFLYYNAEYKK